MTHLLLQASGKWRHDQADLQGEVWVCTTRLVVNTGTIDDLGDLPTFVARAAQEEEIGATASATSNWNLSENGAVFSPVDYLGGEALTAWSGFLATAPALSNLLRLTQLALYPVGPNMRAQDVDDVPKNPAVAHFSTYEGEDIAPPGTGTLMPVDVACCLSWGTNRNSARGRGRMYVPGIETAAMGTSTKQGRFSDAFVGGMATAGAQFINDLTASGIGQAWEVKPAVVSSRQPIYSLIRSVRVGQEPDTQRRRGNRNAEKYVVEMV